MDRYVFPPQEQSLIENMEGTMAAPFSFVISRHCSRISL